MQAFPLPRLLYIGVAVPLHTVSQCYSIHAFFLEDGQTDTAAAASTDDACGLFYQKQYVHTISWQPEELRVHSVLYESIKSTTYILIYCGTMQ